MALSSILIWKMVYVHGNAKQVSAVLAAKGRPLPLANKVENIDRSQV